MLETDLPAVTSVGLESFGWFWHNTLDTLSRALSQAISATIAEDDSGVIGYQLSTGNLLGAHLARLGVRLDPNQLNRLSGNTQSDNATSLSLYKKLGFVRTGEQFPVFVYPGENNG